MKTKATIYGFLLSFIFGAILSRLNFPIDVSLVIIVIWSVSLWVYIEIKLRENDEER